MSTLEDSEVRVLCDWSSQRLGGYATTRTCPNGLGTQTYADQNECAQQFLRGAAQPTCTATVADVERCINAAAADPCSVAMEVCAPLRACAASRI
jgi:hypothetical protein